MASLDNTKKKLIIIAGTLLVVAVGFVVWSTITPSELEKQKEQELQVNNQRKAEVNDQAKESRGDDYTPPVDSAGIDATAKQDGNQVIITTKLVGYSDGNCTLKISNGSTSKTLPTVPIIYQSAFSTCAGFSVSTDSLGTGTWSIELGVVSGGITTSKEISVEVK